jgi:hypothetical protein
VRSGITAAAWADHSRAVDVDGRIVDIEIFEANQYEVDEFFG